MKPGLPRRLRLPRNDDEGDSFLCLVRIFYLKKDIIRST